MADNTRTLENASRRKVVKSIVGGATAVAAYNLLPARWGTPIIESVFLPAHAATSGLSISPCQLNYTGLDAQANYTWTVTFSVSPSVAGETLLVRRIVKATDTTHDNELSLTTGSDGSVSFSDAFESDFFISLQYLITLDDGSGQVSCEWSGPA